MRRAAAVVIVWLALTAGQVFTPAQTALLQQRSDGAAPQAMSAEELDALGDPLFRLVLKDHPQEVRLDEIERLIMGASGRRHLFVVDEHLQDPAPGGSRRAVFVYKGSTQGIRLDPNVALSAAFDSARFAEGVIEAWGWDDRRSRYNYYKLDGTPATWKFRGSSVGADQLTPAQRRGTCMTCHVNGGPVMKELPIPWNNWHSSRNQADYLLSTSPGRWPIAGTPRFRDLKGAEGFESDFVMPSIRQFNGRRLTSLITPGAAAGQSEVTDGPRALRPLFRTVEYNIISAGQFSGLHPLPAPVAAGAAPTEAVAVPDTFFLNANLLGGGGFTQYKGLGIPEARLFSSLLLVQPAEYRGLVSRAGTTLGGRTGDTHFAWFVPEPSHIDNHFVDLLIAQGVITREFAAAALAVDLETPAFSDARDALRAVIPARFTFKPLNAGDVPAAHPDALTLDVIARLRALTPAAGSPEAQFLALLENPDPVGVLRATVTAYMERVRARLADPAQRQGELDRLYRLMLARAKTASDTNPALVESDMLFAAGPP